MRRSFGDPSMEILMEARVGTHFHSHLSSRAEASRAIGRTGSVLARLIGRAQTAVADRVLATSASLLSVLSDACGDLSQRSIA
jgi:hypothetical protein